ncbi:hypothetical protein BIZ46_00540 [Helicobacter pylori]|nr:hypothetical protein BIZ46_00540 [Helicobacter pylori]
MIQNKGKADPPPPEEMLRSLASLLMNAASKSPMALAWRDKIRAVLVLNGGGWILQDFLHQRFAVIAF